MHTEENSSILVVDDDQQVLKSIRAVLQEGGYRTEICHNGIEALETFKQGGQYDVVLSDIKMPGMDGIALLAHLRELDQEVPVILHTGYADLESAMHAVKHDAFDYLLKPADPEALLKSVGKAVLHRNYARMEKAYQQRLEAEVQAATVELFHLVEELRKARDEALEASRLKSEFIANVSHELRTPLNHIIGLTDVIMEMNPSPAIQEYLTVIDQSATALNQMLSNVLELSTLDSGKTKLLEENFNLDKVLATLNLRYAKEAEGKGLDLTFGCGNQVPVLLRGDPARLEQALAALLDNAVKFTDQGEISLAVDLQQADREAALIRFTVKDTGCGIPDDKIFCIFKSFRQADGSLTRIHGGAGLGLAIAQRLVRLMGGEIEVKTSVGKGSAFTFTAKFKLQAAA